MTPRAPSNTLIVTNVDDHTLSHPEEFIGFLVQNHKNCIQLISLIKFGRIILVCEDKYVAINVKESLLESSEWSNLKISYSIRDNEYFNLLSGTEDDDGAIPMDYLELPLEVGSKRFLISPPRSPPPDWDQWDKVEEGPNRKAIYSPEDVSHLLWQKLGGMDSSIVRKYQEEQLEDDDSFYNQHRDNEVDIKTHREVLFEGLDDGIPAIIIDSDQSVPRKTKTPPASIPKTALPPMHD